MRRLALACVMIAGLSASGCTQLDHSKKYAVTGMATGAVAAGGIAAGLGEPFLGTALIGGLLGGALGFVYGEYWAEEVEGDPQVLF